MKKNILLLLIVILTSISDSFSNNNSLPLEGLQNRSIQIGVKFSVSKPRSGCEKFPGICKMTAEILGRNSLPVGLTCYGNASYENGKLSIEVLFSDMSFELQSDFEKISYFPIDEQLLLDPILLKALGAPENSSIQVGRSLIIKDGEKIKLTLILK